MKYILFRAGAQQTHSNINKTKKIHTNILFNLGFVEIISSPQIGVIVANHLASTDN